MARAATTTDVFNAVAEPRRREILDLLVECERSVGDLADMLSLAQPQVSKHLRVLREVGAVEVRDSGRSRVYRVRPDSLRPIHEWVRAYAALWSQRFERLDAVLAEMEGDPP